MDEVGIQCQARLAFFFCLFFSLFLASDAVDTLFPNQQLVSNENPFIDSSGGTFRLGFFSPAGSRNRFVGIWYRNIPTQTIVWVANRDSPFDSNSSVLFQLSVDGNLQIIANGTILWSSGLNRTVRSPVAELLESGNLVVREESDANPDNYFWESFDHPTDTVLPGMKLGKNFVTGVNRILRSWANRNDPFTGNYSFFLETSGYPSLVLYNGGTERFNTGPWNGERFSGVPGLRPNSIHTYKFVLNQEEAYFLFHLINTSVISIVVLNFAGIIERLTWNYRTQDWTTLVTMPADSCDTYSLCHSYGFCDAANAPVCRCLDRFRPTDVSGWNAADWSSGCERRTPLDCASDGFVRYTGVKLPDTRNSWYNERMSTRDCESMCLRNCSCTAYANTDIRGRGSGCMIWFDELIDIRNLQEYGQDIFIRMASSELDSNGVKVMVLTVSMPIVAVILLLGVVCIVYRWKQKKEERSRKPWMTREVSFGIPSRLLRVVVSKTKDQDLPAFDLAIIQKATDYFSPHNKIGEGGFGPVYKGNLQNGQEIAVKRLSKSSVQGVDEFKNEVILLERLQHRNLVKLLGCCIEKEEMMLVYEFMPNSSLDSFIFDEDKRKLLDWPSRIRIINGIARGLLYLHQDSRLRIIHRDLKAGNVLLDDEMNPKISDFGMARIFAGTEAKTKRIVGTYGYMSPEYAVDGNFSVKSDVFSYGVLVLEIISGCKNRGFLHSDHHHNLLGHAWIMQEGGRSSELIDTSISESCHIPEILRTIHVGLLCVQQNPEDRPSMSTVVLMLSSEQALCKSKPPGFFTERNLFNEANSQSSQHGTSTVNEFSMTIMEGR